MSEVEIIDSVDVEECDLTTESLKFFKKGQVFESYEQLVGAVNALESATHQLWTKVKAENSGDPIFKVSKFSLKCKHDTKYVNKQLKGTRPKQSVLKRGCKAHVHVTFNKLLGLLAVTSVGFKHNHEISKEWHDFQSSVRSKFSDENKKLIEAAEKLESSNPKLLAALHDEGKQCTCQDLANFKFKGKGKIPEIQQIIQFFGMKIVLILNAVKFSTIKTMNFLQFSINRKICLKISKNIPNSSKLM